MSKIKVEMLDESHRRTYYSLIKERCAKLIEMHIWDGIDKNKFDAWLNNFKDEKEKFFAACILDNFIYRSEAQTISMLYDLLTRDLDNLFRMNHIYLNQNPLELLQNKHNDPGFRIVAAIKSSDSSAKSGYFMCNLIVHQLRVSEKWVKQPQNIQSEIDNGITKFVLLDDIICSGSQMKETIEEWKLDNISNVSFYIAVCAAHEDGVKMLNDSFPEIKITQTENLLINDCFFHCVDPENFDCKTIEELKDFYKTFMNGKNVRYGNLFGFGNSGLLYAFKHNVPNNCLPIIHYHNDQFNSLVNKKI